MLYGDADIMAEPTLRFERAGVSELSVALRNIDELHWFSDNVIAKNAG